MGDGIKVMLVVVLREQGQWQPVISPGNCRCLTLFHVLVCPGLASENNLFLGAKLPSSRLHLLLIPAILQPRLLPPAADREGVKPGDTGPR